MVISIGLKDAAVRRTKPFPYMKAVIGLLGTDAVLQGAGASLPRLLCNAGVERLRGILNYHCDEFAELRAGAFRGRETGCAKRKISGEMSNKPGSIRVGEVQIRRVFYPLLDDEPVS